jgi:hypothetical protein
MEIDWSVAKVRQRNYDGGEIIASGAILAREAQRETTEEAR